MTQVVAGVQLVHVEAHGPVVKADVFGGDGAVVMGEIAFLVDDPTEHERIVTTFREWESSGQVVTLVEGEDGVVSVIDERDAFRAAIGELSG